jgi:hypothetical protein
MHENEALQPLTYYFFRKGVFPRIQRNEQYTESWTVCASVGSANNMNKLSSVGMQLREKWEYNYFCTI